MYVHMTVVLKCAFAVDLNSVNVNFINEFDQDNSSQFAFKNYNLQRGVGRRRQ